MIQSEGPTQEARPTVRHEAREIAQREGVTLPTSTLWAIKSGGRAGIFPFSQVYPHYLQPLEGVLSRADATPRSSSLAEIVELVRTGEPLGFRPTKMMPHVFAREVAYLNQQAITAARAGNPPPVEYELYRSFMEGSDFDARVAVPPDEMKGWTEQLVEQTLHTYAVNKKKYRDQPQVTEDGTTIWTIPLDEAPIVMLPRETMDRPGRQNTHHDPVIRITYRRFADSGIPSCDWQLIARGQVYDPALPEEVDLPLVSVGISPRPEMLSAEQRAKDTRMGPKVNSWDRIDSATLTDDVGKLSDPLRSELIQPSSGQFSDMTQHGLMALPFQFNRFETGPDGVTRCIAGDLPQSFIRITPEQFATLDDPIAFGPDFGNATIAPETTLIEAFRVVRKGLRYHGIEASDQTERARQLIASDTLKARLAGQGSAEQPTWWQKDITREAATACWYSPREFIAMGQPDNFNLRQYFPHWKYLAEIADRLPSRAQSETQLRAFQDAGRVYVPNAPRLIDTLKAEGLGGIPGLLRTLDAQQKAGERLVDGGWKMIAHEVRQANARKKGTDEYNVEIAKRNDLQLIFWLLSTHE